MKPTTLAVAATAALSACSLQPSAFCSDAPRPNTARPNILWLVAEDATYNYFGAYGDPLARTPNFDRLAARGILYERAHSTAPVSAPSRHSIITGCYASSNGAQHMRSQRPLPAGVRFFPEFLRKAGYYCTNNAKTDYNTSTPHAPAWDESSKTAHWRNRKPNQPFFAVFNTEESHESRIHKRVPLTTDPARVKLPAYLPDTPETRADTAQYYDCVHRADAALGKILAQLEADGLADDTIIFYYSDNGGVLPRSKRFLYDNGTHIALVMYFPDKYKHLAPAAPGARVRAPVNFVDFAPTVLSLAGLPPAPQFQGRALAGPDRPATAPRYTYTHRNRMDEIHDFSRAVTDGRYTYIRNYMPHLPAGQRLSYLWQSASMQKWDELYRTAREKLTPEQRAFFEPRPHEELYDCDADPDNVNNLASNPAHFEKLFELSEALRAHMLSIRDTGFFPEAMMIALADGRSPREIAGMNNKNYPLELLLNITEVQGSVQNSKRASEMFRHRVEEQKSLVESFQRVVDDPQSPAETRQRAAVVVQQLKNLPDPSDGRDYRNYLDGSRESWLRFLRHPAPVVRYWAIVSLLAYPPATLAADCAPLLDDPDPCVRAAAAEALIRHDATNAPAWRTISALLAPTHSRELRVQVLNSLMHLPAPPLAVRAQIASIAAETDSGEYIPRLANHLLDKFQIPKPGPTANSQKKKSQKNKKRQ